MRERNPKPLEPMDGWGINTLHKCSEQMNENSPHPIQEQQEQVI
jgi:hypothetical protein